jgi:flagellar motor switch protein FliN/FliY
MVDISPPSIRLIELNSELKSVSTNNGQGKFVKISFNLDIGGIIKSKLIQALSIVEAKELAKQLIGIMNPSQENEVDINGLLSKEERDVIGEIANISFGAASTSLSTLLRHKVRITAPSIEVIDKNKVEGKGIPQVVLAVNFTKGLLMENILVIDKHVANVIADLMMGGKGEVTEKELSEMELSAVQEAMNQMMGSAATAMSEVFDEVVDISPPVLKLSELQKEIEQITTNEEKDEFVNISFDLDIGGFLKSKLVQAMSIEKAKEMSNKLLKNIAEESAVETYNVVLEEFSPSKVKVKETKVKPILKEVKVKVEVIFGNTVKPLKEILTLEEDDIVALLEEVNEPLKIYANGIFIAEGEIVNVDGYFGVEIKNVHVK